jgi:hypothetical protein
MVNKDWSYIQGAIILAGLNVLYLALTGHAWGITSAMTDMSLQCVKLLGIDTEQWAYYQDYTAGRLENDPFWETGWIVFGMGAGAMLGALAGRELRFKKLRTYKQIGIVLGGGILMGFGSRLAFGCNIGTLLNGIASHSLHGWIFLVGMIIGTMAAIPLLKRYMM